MRSRISFRKKYFHFKAVLFLFYHIFTTVLEFIRISTYLFEFISHHIFSSSYLIISFKFYQNLIIFLDFIKISFYLLACIKLSLHYLKAFSFQNRIGHYQILGIADTDMKSLSAHFQKNLFRAAIELHIGLS